MTQGGLNYKDSGVDVDANMSWTKWIAAQVKADRKYHGITHVSPIGGFAGAMKLPPQIISKIIKTLTPRMKNFEEGNWDAILAATLSSFSLVACTDGVGTKTMIGERFNRIGSLSYDMLAMNVNDMVAGGATPIACLDYIGCKSIKEGKTYRYQPFVEELIKACREINVELIGGETSEMGANYTEFGSDLTGFALGIIMDNDIPKVDTIEKGDAVFALKSSGIHSNGYSLIRKMLEEYEISYSDTPEELEGKTVLDAVLEPTRLYVNQALAANATGFVKSMAHITGGGLIENIERSLPKGKNLNVELEHTILYAHSVFDWIKNVGIEHDVMMKTFNMGYGFTFIANINNWDEIEKAVGEKLFLIGYIV